MPHHAAAAPAAVGCYPFLRAASRRGYSRLAASGGGGGATRVEVGRERRVFHVDPAVLEAEPLRRLVAAAGRRRRGAGAAVVVEVEAILFEHLLWLASNEEHLAAAAAAADLEEIVDFYSQDDDF